jgi:gliding motility-associated-like protein
MKNSNSLILSCIVLFLGHLSVWSQTPTMNCPNNQTFNGQPGGCGNSVNYTTPTCATNCGGATITQTDGLGLTSGDFFTPGLYNLEYTISNGSESSVCLFSVTVLDPEMPQVTCDGNLTAFVDANCNYILPDYTLSGNFSATDNCSIATTGQIPPPGTVINGAGEVTQIIVGATDPSGNLTTCSFNLTLVDNIAPVIVCPANQFTAAGINCEGTLQEYIALSAYSDNCTSNPLVVQTPAVGTTFTDDITVTLTITDATGNFNSCTFDVIVDDVTAPTITCPSNTVRFVDSACEYEVEDFSLLTSAIDNCSSQLSFTQTPAINTKLSVNNSSHFITMTATDFENNSSVCSFTVTLLDTIAPVFGVCNDTIIVLNNGCSYTMANFIPVVGYYENCSSIASSQVPAAGTIINSVGITPVTITLQDVDGNSSTCVFQLSTIDTLVPTISNCPGNQTFNASASDCSYLMADFTTGIITTDQCSGSILISQFPEQGTIINAGTTQNIEITVADASGNTNTCNFDITVVDITNPVLICPLNPSVNTSNLCQYEIPDYQNELAITDNCGIVASYSQTPIAGTVISGLGTQQNISLFATDQYGNTASCSFTITLADNTPPTIDCPGDQQVTIDQNCQYTVPDFSALVSIIDECDANPTITQTPQAGITLNGFHTVTIIATDANGNEASCSFEMGPLDAEAPSITCPSDLSQCNPVVTFATPLGFDNCGIVTVSQTDGSGLSSGSTFPQGTTTLSFEAADQVGNTQQCSFNVTIFPTISITVPASQTINEGDTIELDALITNGTNYSWTPDFYLSNDSVMNPSASPVINTTYTVVVTNDDGCSATASTIIYVNENQELIINNFISPNGDGKNETWKVNKPSLISGCLVSIYDRWGKEVWTTDMYQNNWKGNNMNDEPLPDGTYFYSIRCAGKEPIKGSILLVR